jgi:hypothetical protein
MFFRLIFLHLILFSSVFCCPDGSLSWNNYCYILTQSEYGRAEWICQKNGGHLASIHDAFTNAEIAQNASDYFGKLPDFWIGANSLSVKNVWEWTDGSNFDYNDWRKGEPKNTSDSMCASVSMNDGYWSAENCFTYKPFVCEILNTDPITTTMKTTGKTLSSTTTKITTTSVRTTPTMTPSLPVLRNCSSGWTYFAPTSSFYCANYTDSGLTWQQGEDYCNSIGGHLTSVHSDLENRLIWAYVNYMGCYGQAPWLGLYTVDNETTYQWTDGSNYDYQRWFPGYPNVNEGTCVATGGLCNACNTDDIGSFQNLNCSFQYGVICKKV